MTTKYNICDKLVYLNTATGKLEHVEIKGIQIVPTDISKDEKGNNVLNGCVVLYQPFEGPVLTEDELFVDEAAAKIAWSERVNRL